MSTAVQPDKQLTIVLAYYDIVVLLHVAGGYELLCSTRPQLEMICGAEGGFLFKI